MCKVPAPDEECEEGFGLTIHVQRVSQSSFLASAPLQRKRGRGDAGKGKVSDGTLKAAQSHPFLPLPWQSTQQLIKLLCSMRACTEGMAAVLGRAIEL